MQNNPAKTFEFIRLYPKLTADPIQGRAGEMYYNVSTNRLRICVNSVGPVWSSLNMPNGTFEGSMLRWNNTLGQYEENAYLTLTGNLIKTTDANGINAKLSLQAGSALAFSNQSGGDISLTAGLGDGIGVQGKTILNGRAITLNAIGSSDPSGGVQGDIYFNTIEYRYKYHDGTLWRPVGSAGGLIIFHIFDAFSTTLPVGVGVLIDGVSIANNDLVLFTNLTSGNNQVYKANVSGGSVIGWANQLTFEGNAAPAVGDMVIVQVGTSYAMQIARFNGTNWLVNDKLRMFNGASYYEQSAIYSTVIANNTLANVFAVTALGSENIIVDYSILRGSAKETGSLQLTTDGANVALSQVNAELSPTGVTFTANILSGNIQLRYQSDNSGSAGVMKFTMRRWSDTSVGPAGPPSYSPAPVGVTPGGSSGDIQFNSGGTFAGNDNFKVDTVNSALVLGTMQYVMLQSTPLLDNQSPAAPVFAFNAATYKSAEIEYSVDRNGARRTGRILIATNGTTVSSTDDFVEQGVTGVLFSTDVSSGNVRLLYTSTSTGFGGTFSWSYRRWS
jgi:hypothetical protein